MNGELLARSLWLIGALVLVGSSLIARGLPNGKIVFLGLIWLAIIVALTGMFSAIGIAH